MKLQVMLRSGSALLGVALAVGVPGIAEATNYAGSWSVSGAMGSPLVETIAPVCVFRQAGNALAGSCKGAAGIGPASGGVNGAKITWRWARTATSHLQRNGIITFFGVLGPNGITGTWSDSGVRGIYGTFIARRL